MGITYRGPLGDEVKNIDCSFISNLVFKKDENYWRDGGGDSCIEIEGLSERLIFFLDEPYGFFIMRHPDYLAPYDGNIEPVEVRHYVGGEPMTVSSCYYVSREKAEDILCEFVSKKKIPEWVNWKDIYK